MKKRWLIAGGIAFGWIAPTWMKKSVVSKNAIVLTFDDGPHPHYTPQLLALLKQYHIKAAFFVVGHKVKKYPHIIKQIHEEGHTIGIHHYEHISSWLLTPQALRQQIEETASAIKHITGQDPRFYRPPWGHRTLASRYMPYEQVLWTKHFKDWRIVHMERMTEEMHQAAHVGGVWLLHDCGKTLGAELLAPQYMLKNLTRFLQTTDAKFISLEQYYDG